MAVNRDNPSQVDDEMLGKWVTLFADIHKTHTRLLFILISGSQLQASNQTIEHLYRFPIPHYDRCNKLEGGGGRKFVGRKIVDPSTPIPKNLQWDFYPTSKNSAIGPKDSG